MPRNEGPPCLWCGEPVMLAIGTVVVRGLGKDADGHYCSADHLARRVTSDLLEVGDYLTVDELLDAARGGISCYS